MNRIVLGTLCGISFGVIDVLMTVFGNHPDRTTGMLLQAFSSRFAIGFLAANVSLRVPPALAGAIVGLLISLPDAFALKAYAGILGTGLISERSQDGPPAPGEPRFLKEDPQCC